MVWTEVGPGKSSNRAGAGEDTDDPLSYGRQTAWMPWQQGPGQSSHSAWQGQVHSPGCAHQDVALALLSPGWVTQGLLLCYRHE